MTKKLKKISSAMGVEDSSLHSRTDSSRRLWRDDIATRIGKLEIDFFDLKHEVFKNR